MARFQVDIRCHHIITSPLLDLGRGEVERGLGLDLVRDADGVEEWTRVVIEP